MTCVTPMYGALAIETAADESFTVTAVIDNDDPVFLGHYPDFPIYPGVCLIELAHQSVFCTRRDRQARLASIDSTRFLSPVFPGDQLTLDGKRKGEQWTIAIAARHRQALVEVARVRLSFYRIEDV